MRRGGGVNLRATPRHLSIRDRPMGLDEAMRGAAELIARGAKNLIRLW
jgi:hypothetical protein